MNPVLLPVVVVFDSDIFELEELLFTFVDVFERFEE